MSYYKDVYLKRLNRFGNNIQERIQGKKEYDFQYFKEKSPNKVYIDLNKNRWDGVLQTNVSNEKEVISYLLVNKDIQFNDGDILKTTQFVDKKEQQWLVFHRDIFTSIGYNRYQVVELDRTIQWIEDGIVHEELVHITGSGANLRDKSITEKFTIQYDLAAVYLPNKILNLVMKTNANFKKGTRIIIEEEVWKVTGIDKISVPGVSYVTLKEDYIDKMGDTDYADSQKLQDWTIQSTFGEVINLVAGEPTKLDFIAYYQGTIRNEELTTEIQNSELIMQEEGIYTGLSLGTTSIKVYLSNTPEVYKIFTVEISDSKQNIVSIIGPETLRMLETAEYTLTNINLEDKISAKMKNNFAKIIEIKENKILISGEQIGEDKLQLYIDDTLVFEKIIKVNSLWMEG